MSLEFKFAVISTNVDGDKSTSKFTNAKSAYMWAKRLQEEEIKFSANIILAGTSSSLVEIQLADLKKEAGPIKASNNKRKRR